MGIGFTGTRMGMTEKQEKKFEEIIKKMDVKEFHHGDCIGSDEEAHEMVRKHHPNAKIFVHPPIDKKARAFCKGDFSAPEKEYIKRDCEIVDACEKIIATPKEKNEVIRSGTWATVRYARRKHKKVIIIDPNGNTEQKE